MQRGPLIATAVEVVALGIGTGLSLAGVIPWYVVPLFLFLPPVLAVIALVVSLLVAQSRGENPFQ